MPQTQPDLAQTLAFEPLHKIGGDTDETVKEVRVTLSS